MYEIGTPSIWVCMGVGSGRRSGTDGETGRCEEAILRAVPEAEEDRWSTGKGGSAENASCAIERLFGRRTHS